MKKRKFLLVFFVLLVVLISAFLVSAENVTKVNDAYNCLENKIGDCADLSVEEEIFSLLAVHKCKSELLDDSVNDECFPASGCKVKATAEAILALDKVDADTSKAEEWLLQQNKTPTDVNWYLQIDSPEETICTINYGSAEYSFYIGTDKKINQGGGCFSLAQGGYWLEISSACYGKEFAISCDKQFLTSLIFKKKDSSKVYVSGNTNSASAEGMTKEKVDSYCFNQAGICNYEASLWATLVLDYLGYDVKPYLPYLITMSEANPSYLPETFLYILTGDASYREEILEKQKADYWDESGDKFYDTAVALYPFQYETGLQEKVDSQEWLVGVQDNQGCWKGNIRNTAFLLYSLWPKDFNAYEDIPDETEDCEDDIGGFCLSSINCEDAGGEELYAYSSTCSGLNVCCDKEKTLEVCGEIGGEECASGQKCSTSTTEAFDTSECCLGYCREIVSEATDCEKYGGICKTSCSDAEQETIDSCDSIEVCCMEKEITETNYWWIWVLLILIVLVLIAIIFRDKLRSFWFRFSSKGGRPKSQFPPSRGYGLPQRNIPRRLPMRSPSFMQRSSQEKPSFSHKPPIKKSSELDDVLKKLKDMGK